MTGKSSAGLDVFELLMQDHREVESLLREFEYRNENSMETAGVISDACAELKMHDTLETQFLYAAVGEAADEDKIDRLVLDVEEEHDRILALIEKLEQTRTDNAQRNACFSQLAELVGQHVLKEETERFPLVRKLKGLDVGAVTVALQKRRNELISEMRIAGPGGQTAQSSFSNG
jgi:iron-sulfur cluster repair protein YtfE (RIC family)